MSPLKTIASQLLFALFATSCSTDPNSVTLPTPTGPYTVGVTQLSRFYTTAYYPAQPGTGQGHRRYASPALLKALDIKTLDVTATAEIGALPLANATPHPVVVLSPGGASFAELSTSLAEQLASNGYIVITVQPDAELENGETGLGGIAPAPALTEALRLSRLRLITDAIDLLDDPTTVALVGPVDHQRIAVGGHSYGGSASFNASLVDKRIAAAFDLDGSLFESANTTLTTVPSLVVMAFMYQLLQHPDAFGDRPDVTLALSSIELIKRNSHIVAVGLENAEHYDVTDAAAIAPALPKDADSLHGAIGPDATTTTNMIVQRFLDATLGAASRLPTSTELGLNLPSTVPLAFP